MNVRMMLGLVMTFAVGCGGDDGRVPTAVELYGTWANVATEGSGTVRALEFAASSERPELAGLSPTYLLYNYPLAAAPTVVQTGSYAVEPTLLNLPGGEVEDDALVTIVAFDQAGTPAGTRYGNAIDGFDGAHFTFHLATGETRIYDRVDALP